MATDYRKLRNGDEKVFEDGFNYLFEIGDDYHVVDQRSLDDGTLSEANVCICNVLGSSPHDGDESFLISDGSDYYLVSKKDGYAIQACDYLDDFIDSMDECEATDQWIADLINEHRQKRHDDI